MTFVQSGLADDTNQQSRMPVKVGGRCSVGDSAGEGPECCVRSGETEIPGSDPDMARGLSHHDSDQVVTGNRHQQFAGDHLRRLSLNGVQPNLFFYGSQVRLDFPAYP